MKIVKLRALNINSLKGETQIDLLSFLEGSSLFAIIGETGSGKSTLLDVISCALYGKTSRLENPSELMSRGTGEASCEVEFEIAGERYRSLWSVKRARGRAEGRLQQPKMELSYALTGEIIESKKSLVPKKIEELTGLDFGRFTQSMMLSQGDFDAFLKAPEKDRSALLEKMTGTRIYSEISRMAYEEYIESKSEVESLEQELELIDTLSAEDLGELEQEIQKKTIELAELEKRSSTAQKLYEWKKELTKLEKSFAERSAKLQSARERKEKAREDFERVALAKRAAIVDKEFRSVRRESEEFSKKTAESKKIAQEIERLKVESKKAAEAYGRARDDLNMAKELHDSQKVKLQKAREVRTKMDEKKLAMERLEKESKRKSSEIATLQKDFEGVSTRREDLRKKMESLQEYLREHSEDARLPSELPLISKLTESYRKLTGEKGKDEKSFAEKKREFLKLETKLKRSRRELESETKSFAKLSEDYETVAGSLERMQKDESSMHRKRSEITELQSRLKRYRDTLLDIEKESAAERGMADRIVSGQEFSRSLAERHRELTEHIGTLEAKEKQELLIQKYEEDRERLEAGEPCYLCGSTEHPYVVHGISLQGDTKEKLSEKKRELEKLAGEISKNEKEYSGVKALHDASLSEIEKLRESAVSDEVYFSRVGFVPDDESEMDLREHLREIEKFFDKLSAKREESARLLKLRDEARAELERQRTGLNDIEKSYELTDAAMKDLSERIAAVSAEIEGLRSDIEKNMERYGTLFDEKSLDMQFDALKKRSERYLKYLESIERMKSDLQKLSEESARVEAGLSSAAGESLGIDEKMRELKSQRQELERELAQTIDREDFDGENLDSYEKRIDRELANRGKVERSASERLSSIETSLREKGERQKSLLAETGEIAGKLEEFKRLYGERLAEENFVDEDEFLSARMEERELQRLDKLCSQIEDVYRKADTLFVEVSDALTKQRSEALTAESEEKLESVVEEMKERAKSLQRDLGASMQRLETHKKNEKRFEERMKRLQVKKEELSLRTKLSELIGSADGAKFSKFAQGITLERLVYLANLHLEMLSDRYLIVRRRDDRHLLEMDILDKYQGDEIRPVSTLSGGESFLVSLSLALGLSELASRRISIDSLFLDEGFGTLDRETLETALSALSTLESRGKMIGVISHVEALKEWIPLQIRVEKQGGGSSRVVLVH